jgi:regulator of ribonuclease activity B
MNLVHRLADIAVEDSRLLVHIQGAGDRAELPRDIDFVLYARDEEKARLVANFVSDYRYGRPSVERSEDNGVVLWRLVITIHAPTTENVVMTLSAFMVCLSRLFNLDYDGWQSQIKR